MGKDSRDNADCDARLSFVLDGMTRHVLDNKASTLLSPLLCRLVIFETTHQTRISFTWIIAYF